MSDVPDFDSGAVLRNVGSAIAQISQRIRRIEAQVEDEPTEYLVAGSHLTLNSAIGATSVNVSTFPEWAKNISVYVLIDVGTVDAELRRVISVDQDTLGLEGALEYAHSEGDAVIFLEDADVNIKWFGAVGAPGYDDTLPIQRALNQVSKGSGSGSVRIPAGAFGVYEPIYVSDSSVSIIGAGSTVSMIVKADSFPNDTDYFITVANQGGFELRDLTIWADSNNSLEALHIDYCNNFIIRNVRFRGANDNKYKALKCAGCNTFFIDSVEMQRYPDGAEIRECHNFVIYNCYFGYLHTTTSAHGFGINVIDSSRFVLSHNSMLGEAASSSRASIRVSGSSTFVVVGNNGYDMLIDYIAIDECSAFAVSGNTSYGYTSATSISVTNSSNGMLHGNANARNKDYLKFSDNTGVSVVGESSANDIIVASTNDLTSSYASKLNSLYSEFVPALSISARAIDPSVLTRVGKANDDPYVWRIPRNKGVLGGYYFNFSWRCPLNLWGTKVSFSPVLWYDFEDDWAADPSWYTLKASIAIYGLPYGISRNYAHDASPDPNTVYPGLRMSEFNFHSAASDFLTTGTWMHFELRVYRVDDLLDYAASMNIYGVELRFLGGLG